MPPPPGYSRSQKHLMHTRRRGAADDWLASINITAITVELSTHDSIEWDKNQKGIAALLNYFAR
jgi:hypothetical protein